MVHRLITLSLIALFATGCSGKHFESLSKRDVAVQLVYTGIVLVDREQTLDIKNHPELHENNFILGEHPSDERINTLIPLAIAGHWLVTWWLPKEKRMAWQLFTGGAETAAVFHNYQIGLK